MSGTFGGINPNGVWSLYVRDDGGSLDGTGGTAGCVDRGWQLQFLPLVSASISGRVTNANGQGIRGARVVITSTWLPEPLVATTGSFGYYSFEGLEPYLTYVATVSSGRYMFSTPSRVISLTQNVTDADFIADP